MLGIVVIVFITLVSIIFSGGFGYVYFRKAMKEDVAAKKMIEAQKKRLSKARVDEDAQYVKRVSDMKAYIASKQLEPQDCKLSEWSEWTSCSTKCGGGEQVRTRTVIAPPINGGTECGPLTEKKACNTQSCPVDCQVSDWNEWSSCTASCGGGKQTRSRTILQHNSGGGKECPILTETQSCNNQLCPVDCKVGEWSAWSACDKECGGGTQFRTRRILQEAANGGEQCPALKETRQCNTQQCAKDCQVSEWSKWSECSRTCGGGTQTRTRTITSPAVAGGECPVLSETQACNSQSCSTDCEVSLWSEWSACTKTCGGGTRFRKRVVNKPATGGGKECPPLTEEESCNTQPCPVDCEVGPWTEWGSCSKPCGGGVQMRTRTITKAAANGGKECPVLSETKPCNEQSCQIPPTVSVASPVNCEVSAWTAWSQCDKSCGGGNQTRTRTVTKPAANGGTACPALTETQPCNTQKCPVDCVTSNWSAWDACTKTCGGGKQTRTRSVVTPAANGGKECGSLSETQDCNTQACPVDCVTSNWTIVDACTKSCGGGKQTRTRYVITPAANGGKECGLLSEPVDCNTQTCPIASITDAYLTSITSNSATAYFKGTNLANVQIDCSTGSGPTLSTPKTSVGNNTGTLQISGLQPNSSYKFVVKPFNNNGDEGPNTTFWATSRPLPVNCEVQWGSWSACSKTCGTGTQTRSTYVSRQPANDGAPCPAPQTESQNCNTQACVVPGAVVSTDGRCGPENGEKRCPDGQCCSIFGWCGSGADHCKTYRRSDSVYHGTSAPSSSSFDKVNCAVQWSNWSTCSKSCGTGSQTRTATITRNPANGGDACPALSQSQDCNTQACPVSTDGRCGPDNEKRCPDGQCCSVFGWCGSGTDHCQTYRRSDSAYHGATTSSTSGCDKTACNGTINDYLNRGWWYTSSDFGTCKGCPVVNYPNRL